MYMLPLFYSLVLLFALAAAEVTNPVLNKIYEKCKDECSIKVSKLDARWIPCMPICMEAKLKTALKSQKDSRSFLEKILAQLHGRKV